MVAVADDDRGVVAPASPERGDGARVVGAFLAMAMLLFAVVWWTQATQAPVEEGLHPAARPHAAVGDGVLGGWLWYDGYWYADIATDWYLDGEAAQLQANRQSAAPFFPAYPAVIATVAVVTGDVALAQIISTCALGLVAAVLFHRWCRRRMNRRGAWVATGLLLCYPYAWFLYGSGYADALLLASTLGAFLLLEADRPLCAGLVAVVATASRPTGVFVIVGLAAVALERRGVITHDRGSPLRRAWQLRWDRADRRDAAVLLGIIGFAAYSVAQWRIFHDPLAFMHAERAWGQAQGATTWLKLQLANDFTRNGPDWWLRIAAQIGLVAVFIAATRSVQRRFGWGYGLYALLTAFVPAWSTGDFMGSGRYLLACFPGFAAIGAAGAERLRRPQLALVPSAALLMWLTSLFARGVYLS